MKLFNNKHICIIMNKDRLNRILSAILLMSIITVKLSASTQDTLTLSLKPTINNDYDLIQKALNNKTKSYLKIILNGNFSIDKTLLTTRANTMLELGNNSYLQIKNEKNGGIILSHDNCIVRGGNIAGNGKSSPDFYSGFGILLSGVHNCIVQDINFTRISGLAVFLTVSGNEGCCFNKIINNRITLPAMDLGLNGDEAAILLGYSGKGYSHDNNIVKNNFIDGNDILKIGIGLIGHGRNNTFEGNSIQNLRNYGIISYESLYFDTTLSETKVINNVVRNIGEIGNNKTVKGMGIYLMKSKKSIVSDNKVYNTLRNSDQSETLAPGGISVSLSENTIVRNNIVDGSFMYGITCDYSFNSQIINNTIMNTRKSGAYFINMNNVLIKGNTFKNMGEVAIKGYFEHTNQPHIKEQMNVDTYTNLSTGNNFIIEENKFYTNQNILFFTGTEPDRERGYKGNRITENRFENNTVISRNRNSITERIAFRTEKAGTNIIRNNKFTTAN